MSQQTARAPQPARTPITLTAPRRRRARWVPPLLAAGVVVLLAALWEGLVYLGLPLPAGQGSLAENHGTLMALGFLGTVISLERAVALGAAWAYAAPACAGIGGLAVAAGAPGVGETLVAAGGIVLLAIFAAVHRIQASLHNTVLAAGAVCWVVAAVLWLLAWDIPRFVPWLVGFLVLTIAGERLELSRLVGVRGAARRLFACAAALFAAGLVVSLAVEPVGVRVAGAGLLCLAIWLGRFDLARRTVRTSGLTRYMAAALLTGYAWLGVAGGLWLAVGRMADGPAYDAMLHAVFLGFVFSMIFAHAPVIIPAVLGKPLPYRPVLYLPLALLHGSLLLRLLGGDAAGNRVAWQWGGSLDETALLLFIGLAIWAVRRGATRVRAGAPAGRPAPPPPPGAGAPRRRR